MVDRTLEPKSQYVSRAFLVAQLGLCCTFFVHRLLTFSFLAPPFSEVVRFGGVDYWRAMVVGAASDVWIAACGACLAALGGIGLGRQGMGWWVGAWIGFVALAMALHQGYVEFFRFQFLVAHVEYLWDWDFIFANGSSAFSSKPLATLAVGVVAILVARAWITRPAPTIRPAVWLVSVALAVAGSVALHSANIHYRVQWFVPESLQTNVFENIYRQLVVPMRPKLLTSEEVAGLGLHGTVPDKRAEQSRWLRERLMTEAGAHPQSELGVRLRGAVSELSTSGQAPVVLVLLVESLRPIEMGLYTDRQPSLTPVLDRLGREGVTFERAYATGNVTRGGQEASWCGYLSGVSTAMMRARPDVRAPCLPDALLSRELGFRVAWMHGGEGRFDGQEQFWRQRRVEDLVSARDMELLTKASRGPWGFPDAELMQLAANRLAGYKSESPRKPVLGMILSVTNHIPWTLPQDAPPSIARLEVRHPSERTTAYSDWAIGLLIDELRRTRVWDDLLLIVASDHGVAIPETTLSLEEQQSHIALLASGGLVERAQLGGRRISRFVSQADIAATIAWTLGIENFRSYGVPLFTDGERPWPIFVDTGTGLYFPEAKVRMAWRDVVRGSDVPEEAPEKKNAAIYGRAFLVSLDAPWL